MQEVFKSSLILEIHGSRAPRPMTIYYSTCGTCVCVRCRQVIITDLCFLLLLNKMSCLGTVGKGHQPEI